MVACNDLILPNNKFQVSTKRFSKYAPFYINYSIVSTTLRSWGLMFDFNDSIDDLDQQTHELKEFVQYDMTRSFMDNLDWLSTNESNFEEGINPFIKNCTTLQILVLNHNVVTNSPSGKKAYQSIMFNRTK